jgi:hypothetical protein
MEGQGVPPPATEGSATDSSAEQGLEAGRLPGRSDAGVPGNGSSSWSAAAARARRRGSPATETRADRHSRMIGRRRIRQREAFASTGAEVQLPPARPTRPRPWETRKPGRGQPRWTAAATPPRSQDGWRASENLRKDVGIAPHRAVGASLRWSSVPASFRLSRPSARVGRSGRARARREWRRAGNRPICTFRGPITPGRSERAHEASCEDPRRKSAGFRPTTEWTGEKPEATGSQVRPQGSTGGNVVRGIEPRRRVTGGAEQACEAGLRGSRNRPRGRRGGSGNPARPTAAVSGLRNRRRRGCKLPIPSTKADSHPGSRECREADSGVADRGGRSVGRPTGRERGMTAGGQGPR